MLDLRMLNDMPPGTIFATGTAVDEPDGLFMARTGRTLRWIGKRGHGHGDWCIYCHFSESPIDWIAAHGDKVNAEAHIRKLVPCDDEAFARYRY
jgi:hypothetical protein